MSVPLTQACALLVGEVRAAWDWLAEQRIPGPTDPPTERHIDATQQAIEDREARRDRAARHPPPPPPPTADIPSGASRALVVHRPIVAGPHPDAARVSPIHGRIIVAALLRRAADDVHHAATGNRLRWLLPDPGTRGAVPCTACRAAGTCGCDSDDVQVEAALAEILGHLEHLDDAALTDLHTALFRANRDARRAAGAADVCLVLKAACPACDSRDLVADCTSRSRDEWSIRCRNRLCACTGPGCRCGTPIRYPGKTHVWRGAGGGWHDLADRLGVTYAALFAQATARHSRPIGHTEQGKGGRS